MLLITDRHSRSHRDKSARAKSLWIDLSAREPSIAGYWMQWSPCWGLIKVWLKI